MDFETLPETERNRGMPCSILSGPYSRSSLPSLCCLMSCAPVCLRVNPCVFCFVVWMTEYSVSCWKIKMAKTLSAGSAKPESGPHFIQESSTARECLLEKLLLKKRSLHLLSFKAKKADSWFFLRKFSAIMIIVFSKLQSAFSSYKYS